MVLLCLVIHKRGDVADIGLVSSLAKLGVKAVISEDTGQVRGLLSQMRFDVLVIDADDPHDDLLRDVAELAQFELPLLLVRHAFSERQEIDLLETGANEVIARTASARLVALKILKTATSSRANKLKRQASTLSVGPMKLNPSRMLATIGDVLLPFTNKQFDLLFALAARAGQLVHRSVLEYAVTRNYDDSGRSVDMQICRIRKCLRDAGDSSINIRSVYGYGYCLTVSLCETAKAKELQS